MDRREAARRQAARHARADIPDARDEEWYLFTVEIEALIAAGTQRWAEDFLRGMQETVQRTEWVTTRQREAVRHVRQATRPLQDWARKWPWPID